jgi:hypothetical protein
LHGKTEFRTLRIAAMREKDHIRGSARFDMLLLAVGGHWPRSYG